MNLVIKAAALATLSAATAASFEPLDRPSSEALCLAAARVQLPPGERRQASLREQISFRVAANPSPRRRGG